MVDGGDCEWLGEGAGQPLRRGRQGKLVYDFMRQRGEAQRLHQHPEAKAPKRHVFGVGHSWCGEKVDGGGLPLPYHPV
jgi:hypothetical protein